MAENLPDVVVTEQREDTPPSYDESLKSETESLMAEMKAKSDVDKKEVRRMLDDVKQVKEKAGEGLYNSLFGMVVQDCVDSIVKKEVIYLTTEMCRFRNNISEKMVADESRMDAPMNIARLYEGFAEAWKIWRAGDTEEGRKGCQRREVVSSFSDCSISRVKKRLRAKMLTQFFIL